MRGRAVVGLTADKSVSRLVRGESVRIASTFLVAVVAFVIVVSEAAAQQVITMCGESSGYGYYLEPKRQGWVVDGVSNGSITVSPPPKIGRNSRAE